MLIKILLGAAILLAAALTPSLAFAGETPDGITYVDAAQARHLLAQNDNLIVLDVRTKGEYKRGHIEGAVRNNYFSTKFKKRLRALDKAQPYLVHCKSGHRSERVVKIMLKEGFTDITHLDGGYDAWKKLPPKTD